MFDKKYTFYTPPRLVQCSSLRAFPLGGGGKKYLSAFIKGDDNE